MLIIRRAENEALGLYRAQQYGIGFDEYKKRWDNECIVIAQIEHIDAVKNIEDILQVKGIDGIIIGPYDLSGSMGYPGEYNRSDVKATVEKVKQICRKFNKPYGFHVIESAPEKLIQKIEDGCTFLAYSIDFFFLGDSVRSGMKTIKEKYER